MYMCMCKVLLIDSCMAKCHVCVAHGCVWTLNANCGNNQASLGWDQQTCSTEWSSSVLLSPAITHWILIFVTNSACVLTHLWLSSGCSSAPELTWACSPTTVPVCHSCTSLPISCWLYLCLLNCYLLLPLDWLLLILACSWPLPKGGSHLLLPLATCWQHYWFPVESLSTDTCATLSPLIPSPPTQGCLDWSSKTGCPCHLRLSIKVHYRQFWWLVLCRLTDFFGV